jgi:ionotropic glutamate receptor
MVVLIAYTASLTASILHRPGPILVVPVDNVDDLARQTRIGYGVIKPSSTHQFFQTSTIDLYERMYEHMTEQNSFFTSAADAVEKVRRSNGEMAAILESTHIDYVTQRMPCDLMTVGGQIYSRGFGLAMPVRSAVANSVSLALLEAREDGTIQKLVRKWWFDRGECGDAAEFKSVAKTSNEKVALPLTLDDMAYPFVFMVIGAVISAIFLIVEIVYKRVCRK